MHESQVNAGTEIEIPPLCDAVLNEPTLDRLCFDLMNCTELLEVIVKARKHQLVSNKNVCLDRAMKQLRFGLVNAIQIRYRYDNALWLDTLMNTPSGVRLVRAPAR